MKDFNFDKYLNIVNKEKEKRGLDDYLSLYPMLRKENDKLYVAIFLSHKDDKIWDATNLYIPDYWVLVDIDTLEIVGFNKTDEKPFSSKEISEKENNDLHKELAKISLEKTIQYQNYLMNDIKKFELPIQERLGNILDNEVDVDGKKVNIHEYIMANIEDDLKKKVEELVDVLVSSKYSSITFYYDCILKNIFKEYKENNTINEDNMKTCISIMNDYYPGVIGITELFNI